jgi:hypothetical protein
MYELDFSAKSKEDWKRVVKIAAEISLFSNSWKVRWAYV